MCQITESKPPFHTEQREKNLTVISKCTKAIFHMTHVRIDAVENHHYVSLEGGLCIQSGLITAVDGQALPSRKKQGAETCMCEIR